MIKKKTCAQSTLCLLSSDW